jgi:short-subunit dehydrogenase involved in D-alanine esterification of teichoic acids
MTIITNPKIEKQKSEIGKTKAKIAEFQAKLREQEKQLRTLEDFEIVAQYRSETLDEGYKAQLQSEEQAETAATEVKAANIHTDTVRKEEAHNAFIKEE